VEASGMSPPNSQSIPPKPSSSLPMKSVFNYLYTITKPSKKLKATPNQWRAEVWWCLGRLLDRMPPYQILVLSSGVWWSLSLDIRCLWRHHTTSSSGSQPTFRRNYWHIMHI